MFITKATKLYKFFQINNQYYNFCVQIPNHVQTQAANGMQAQILVNQQKNYTVEQFYTSCLAEATYYVKSGNDVAIIDPLRDTTPYIEKAKQDGAQIKYILMTHFHADFVSGHEDLAEKTGAQIIYGPNATPGFKAHIAKDNEIFKLGDVDLKILHTPGHTMESSTFMLLNKKTPEAIFTGDTLFLNEVGRPDLAVKVGSITSQDLASYLYDSIHNKIMNLPDNVLVYPGHGPGSPCGKSIGEGTYDLLGNQKKVSPPLQILDKQEFIDSVTSGLPKPPDYFFHDVTLNKSGGSKGIDMIYERNNKPLTIEQFKKHVQEGITIIDTRPFHDFLSKFIPKSYNIDLSQSFALWVGKLMHPSKKFVIITEDNKEKEAIIRLGRIGYDNVLGYLEGGIQAWEKAGQSLQTINLLSAEKYKEIMQNNKNIQSLDVRNDHEFEESRLKISKNIPLWELENIIQKNPNVFNKNEMVYVNCAKGARSVSGASILVANGYTKVSSIEGGLNALKEVGADVQYN